eukprot:2873634-Rhodomonas_salina.2
MRVGVDGGGDCDGVGLRPTDLHLRRTLAGTSARKQSLAVSRVEEGKCTYRKADGGNRCRRSGRRREVGL